MTSFPSLLEESSGIGEDDSSEEGDHADANSEEAMLGRSASTKSRSSVQLEGVLRKDNARPRREK